MVKRVTVIFVVCMFVLSVFAAGAFALESNKGKIQPTKRMLAPEKNLMFSGPTPLDVYRSLGSKYVVTCDDAVPEAGTVIRHGSIYTTWRDLQMICSSNRHVNVTPTGFRNFAFNHIMGASSETYPRLFMGYCINPGGTYETAGQVDGAIGYSVQTSHSTGHLNTGIPVVIYHKTAPEGETPWYTMISVDDDTCCANAGFWTYHWDVPDYHTGATEGGGWCDIAINYDPDSLRDYMHITTHNVAAAPYKVTYERCYFDAASPPNLICQTYTNAAKSYTIAQGTQAGGPLTMPVGVIDEASFVDAVVTTSPVSKRVAVVYTHYACGDEQGNKADDVFFCESMVNGDDWVVGTNWPPTPVNCTNYPCENLESQEVRAHIDLNACYDYEDSLHVIYVALYVPIGTPGSYYATPAWAYHWSKKTGNKMIVHHDHDLNISSQNEGAVSKVSIAAKDPIYHPEEGQYMFATWSAIPDSADKNDTGDQGNYDIFGCGSTDGGWSWGVVYNLTQTATPGCDSGDCVSEIMPSLAENMYNGDLHLQYLCDRDAGSWGFGPTPYGAITENEVYYYDLHEWDVTAVPRGTYYITEPKQEPYWYSPPLKVVPGEDRDVYFTVKSIGNADLHPAVTSSDPTCIGTEGALPTIPPGDSVSTTVTLRGSVAGCQNSFIDGIVFLTTDEPGKKVDSLPIQAIVSNDYYECERDSQAIDSLWNGKLRLMVSANSQLWINDSSTFTSSTGEDTTLQVFFQGGTFVATIRDNDTLVGRCYGVDHDHKALPQDRLHVRQCEPDWEPPYWLLYTENVFIHNLTPPMDDKWYCWVFDKQVKFFKESAPEDYKYIVIEYVRVRRQGPPAWWPGGTADCTNYGDTYIGYVMDLDCPFDTLLSENGRNLGRYDNTNHIAYQLGFDWTGAHTAYNQYACALALAEETDDTVGYSAVVPYGAHNIKNNKWLYPQSPWGFKDVELYGLAATPNVSIEDGPADPDSLVDRTQVITALQIPAGSDPDVDESFIVVGVVAPDSLDMRNRINLARLIVAREKAHGFPAWAERCGDVDDNGNIDLGDVLGLISYLYKNGPAPVTPKERGDVDANTNIDLGDVLGLISYLYKNGPAPKCQECFGIWG